MEKNMDKTPPKSNPSHNIDNILHNSGNDINDEKSDNDIQFIYENKDYKSSSTIFAMIDSDDLDISIMSKRNSEILNGEGIQDVFICPSRTERIINPQPDAEYGTTIRIYNPKKQKWDICYACLGKMVYLEAEKVNHHYK